MGERKVLNKYFPPDFDPSKIQKGKRVRSEDKQMKVRMMLPMSVRCNTCGNFMYKGTKFNTRMEDVKGEDYLGIKIFRFYYKCTNCSAEFCMKTDPKSTDYIVEAGATRNYEPWRDNEQQAEQMKAQREEEEKGNAMKALENRTIDSKREMDILTALDEMKSLKARHEAVNTEAALAALKRAAEAEEPVDLDAEDEEAVQMMLLERAGFVRRLSSSSEEEDNDGGGGDKGRKRVKRVVGAGAIGTALWDDDNDNGDGDDNEGDKVIDNNGGNGGIDEKKKKSVNGEEMKKKDPGLNKKESKNKSAAVGSTVPSFGKRAIIVKPKTTTITTTTTNNNKDDNKDDGGDNILAGLMAYGSDSD